MALLACGIGKGDEVITPALSFVATANVIVRVGARPVFVDVGLDSRNLDLAQVEAAITPRTRAILPVHFAGLAVDMDRLYAIAGKHGLRVIEDAAHAIGSSWRGRRIGSFGDLVVCSIHPNKNMTTVEGGAISGGSPEELAAIELHRWHGQVKRGPDDFDTLLPGGKYNLSDVAAAVGLGQLRRLEEFNARRRKLSARYFELWGAELPLLFERLYPALDALGRSYEVVFVDDGSTDGSVAQLRRQFERRPDVTRVVLLARNAGQHLAILAAFAQTRGAYVITLDADLQNPPE